MTAFQDKKEGLGIIPFMPDGRPCPSVLTAEETITLLRLPQKGGVRTLKYWRDTGDLRGIRLGRYVRYRLEDVLVFLERKTRCYEPR